MALSGLGGDEVFAGYPIFGRSLKLDEQKWIFSLPAPVRRSLGSILHRIKPGIATSKIRQVLNLPDGDFESTFPIARKMHGEKELKNLLAVEHITKDAVAGIVNAELRKGHNHIPLLSKVSIAEITTYMQNVLLRDTDQMSMAVALEVRVPFLDYELVEYVLGIPDKYKKPVFPKKLLVESLGDLLPEEIVHRKKMGFVFPWEVWLRNEMKTFCSEKIHSLAKRDFIHGTHLLKRWELFLRNDPSVRWTDMWIGVVLENWMIENGIES
jgi:asparagine synthase (glutamine-hydrolysing)